MAGMRAPEWASGELPSRLQEAKTHRLERMTSEVSRWTSAADWDIIVSDFELGCKFLELGLGVKLAFWSQLPWVLAGLAHHFVHVARNTARTAVDMFDAMGHEAQARQHHLTL
eukprot:10435611-Alexandrium_andersonii.AAC.1